VRALLYIVAALSFGAPVLGASLAQQSEQHGDVEVSVVLDPAEQSGKATASVRIHASPEVVWTLITSCKDALMLVPGLEGCEVLSTAADGSSQIIRHVLQYSWYVPKLTYDIRAVYDKPTRVTVDRIAGDLKKLQASWTLEAVGNDTVAHYSIDLAPGFWVPHWPKMLRALRSRAEAKPR
jgi:ribosome-associated toxin RatA of RatAB toxin-antitoxin module